MAGAKTVVASVGVGEVTGEVEIVLEVDPDEVVVVVVVSGVVVDVPKTWPPVEAVVDPELVEAVDVVPAGAVEPVGEATTTVCVVAGLLTTEMYWPDCDGVDDGWLKAIQSNSVSAATGWLVWMIKPSGVLVATP